MSRQGDRSEGHGLRNPSAANCASGFLRKQYLNKLFFNLEISPTFVQRKTIRVLGFLVVHINTTETQVDCFSKKLWANFV